MSRLHAVVDVPAGQHQVAAEFRAGVFGWPVLRDPLGRLSCVTGNSPEATRLRDIG